MTDKFEQQMEKVAKHIAEKAVHKETPFAESLDAFKQLTVYFGMLLKHKEPGKPDGDGPNFNDFREQLGEHHGGRSQ